VGGIGVVAALALEDLYLVQFHRMEQFVFAIAERVARAIGQVEERSNQFDVTRPYPLGSFVSRLLNGKRDARKDIP